MMPPLVQYAIFWIIHDFFKEKQKHTGKTNISWPHENGSMVKTYAHVEKNPSVCKFHLKNGNFL